jgi:hypothetical protein
MPVESRDRFPWCWGKAMHCLNGHPWLVSIGCAGLLLAGGCSRLGTKLQLHAPDSMRGITTVVLAPVPADALTLAHCKEVRDVATAALERQTRALGLWSVVSAESLIAMDGRDALATEQAWVEAARTAGRDAVLFCWLESSTADVTTQEATGVWSIGLTGAAKGKIEPEYEPVTKTNWLGPVARVRIVETATGKLVAESKFDVHWGKSYWQNPPADRMVEDAIAGALAPIKRAWPR